MRSLPVRADLSRRRFLGAAAAGAGGLLLAACGSGGGNFGTGGDIDDSAAADEGRKIKIGLVFPRTGPNSAIGVEILNGWQLWLDQNARSMGGYVVETVPADEGNDPSIGVPAVRRLLEEGNVDVVVGMVNSQTTLAVLDQFIKQKKLLLIADAGANDLTDTKSSPYVWRTSYTNAQNSYAMGQYLGRRGILKPYVMAPDYPGGEENRAAFTTAFEQFSDGKVVGSILTPYNATDSFRPFLSTAAAAEPDAVFCSYSGKEAASFIRQYDEFGLKEATPLYGSGFLTEGDALNGLGEAAIGVRTTLHYSSDLDQATNRDFVLSYRQAYDAVPTCYATAAFDAAEVLDAALRSATGLDGDSMASALQGVGLVDRSPRGDWTFEGQSPKQHVYLREVQERNGSLVNAEIEDLGIFGQPEIAV